MENNNCSTFEDLLTLNLYKEHYLLKLNNFRMFVSEFQPGICNEKIIQREHVEGYINLHYTNIYKLMCLLETFKNIMYYVSYWKGPTFTNFFQGRKQSYGAGEQIYNLNKCIIKVDENSVMELPLTFKTGTLPTTVCIDDVQKSFALFKPDRNNDFEFLCKRYPKFDDFDPLVFIMVVDKKFNRHRILPQLKNSLKRANYKTTYYKLGEFVDKQKQGTVKVVNTTHRDHDHLYDYEN